VNTATRPLNSDTMNRFLQSGRFLLAVPMILFGIEHFVYAGFVATLVPAWIPFHLFWTYLVGVALIAAGLAIVTGKQAYLAGVLLGTMIFLFLLLCHIPIIAHVSSDGKSQMMGDLAGRLINMFKDMGLCAAAFIFAGTQSTRRSGTNLFFTLGCFLFAVSILGFGSLHLLYPAFGPGIQPMFPSISFPIPGHLFWVYLSAAVFLASGIGILIRKEPRLAGTVLGITILVFALLTWVPRFGAHPFDMVGNWLKDIGVAGGALILAASMPTNDEPAHAAE
jgi:uncharacterized membrane protein